MKMNDPIFDQQAYGNRPVTEQHRRLTILIAATICVISIVYFMAGCGGGGSQTEVPTQPVSSMQVVVSAVQDMGVITANPSILKRDCGISAMFQERSVWIFGDTLLETPNAENRVFISNSWSSTYDTDAGDGIQGLSEVVDRVGAPATLFPLTEEEQAFNTASADPTRSQESCVMRWHIWPGAIIVDSDKGWAYIFYRKVLVDYDTPGFSHVGHSIAVWKNYLESPERPVFNYIDSYPTLFFSEQGDRGFGSAAVVIDQQAYLYGCELGEDGMSKPCHLARVPLANILDRSMWSFYSGDDKWSGDLHDSKQVFYGNDMMSVFFNPYLELFLAIYSEPLGSTAMLRSAERPEGPWSAPIKLFTVNAPENIHGGWVYDFLAHPEFSPDNSSRIYISYTKKTDQMHSELRLVAVELALSQ
jgi:hypothetical protein